MFLLLIILFRKSAGCSSRSEFTIDAFTMGLYCLSFALFCFCFGLVFILRNLAKLCCEECRVARGWVMHQNRLCRPCLQRRRVWSVHMMPSYKLGFQHSFPYMMLPQAPDQASFPSARSALSYTYDKRNKYASNSAASLQATMVRLTSSSSLGWFLVLILPHDSLLLVMHLIRAKQAWWASCTPLTFFNLCSQSPHNSIDQALIHCTSYESCDSKLWLSQWHLSFLYENMCSQSS